MRIREGFRTSFATLLGIFAIVTSLRVLESSSLLLSPFVQELQERLPLAGVVSATLIIVIGLIVAGAIGGTAVELVRRRCSWILAAIVGSVGSAYALIYFDSGHEPSKPLQPVPFAILTLLMTLGAQLGSQWRKRHADGSHRTVSKNSP